MHAKLILILISSLHAESLKPRPPVVLEAFSRTAQIKTEGNGPLFRVDLNEAVYTSLIHDDLRDLRLYNSEKKSIPYSFQLKSTDHVHGTEVAPLTFYPIFGEKEQNYGGRSRVQIVEGPSQQITTVTFNGADLKKSKFRKGYLIDLRNKKSPLRSLEVDWKGTGSNLFLSLSVEASDDLQFWSSLTMNRTLAKFKYGSESLEQNRIDLPDTQAKYLRITWNGNPDFELTELKGEFTKGSWVETKRHFTKMEAVAEKDGEFFFVKSPVVADRLKIYLPETNSIFRIELASRENEKSNWTTRFSGVVYRVTVEGREIASEFERISSVSDRHWRLTVRGKDASIGSKPPQLEFRWIAHQLFFLARGTAPFQLAYGLSYAEAPDFGLGSIQGELAEQSDSITPVAASLNPEVTQSSAGAVSISGPSEPWPWKQIALWVSLGVAILFTSLMAWKLYRDMKPS